MQNGNLLRLVLLLGMFLGSCISTMIAAGVYHIMNANGAVAAEIFQGVSVCIIAVLGIFAALTLYRLIAYLRLK